MVIIKSKVFLGGTCNESTWRAKLKPLLNTPYFDPVVEDWTDECVKIENLEKGILCDMHLYVITSAMTGVYSIAEAVESVHNKSKKTFFWVIFEGFSEGQIRSLKQVGQIIKRHGGIIGFESLACLADEVNSYTKGV